MICPSEMQYWDCWLIAGFNSHFQLCNYAFVVKGFLCCSMFIADIMFFCFFLELWAPQNILLPYVWIDRHWQPQFLMLWKCLEYLRIPCFGLKILYFCAWFGSPGAWQLSLLHQPSVIDYGLALRSFTKVGWVTKWEISQHVSPTRNWNKQTKDKKHDKTNIRNWICFIMFYHG